MVASFAMLAPPSVIAKFIPPLFVLSFTSQVSAVPTTQLPSWMDTASRDHIHSCYDALGHKNENTSTKSNYAEQMVFPAY